MTPTGELIDTETVPISSEGGRRKRTHKGTSLAAYPTARPVWGGAVGKGIGNDHLAGRLLHTGSDDVLECAAGAAVGPDGERVAVGPGGAAPIPPGLRHRAAGRMPILDVVVPPFDPADERFDRGRDVR